MPNIGILFNAKVAEVINGKSSTKMRIDATWDKAQGIRFRPTTRKAGSNILVSLTPKGKGGLAIELDETVQEKMCSFGMPDDFLQPGVRYSIIEDRYGWMVMLPGDQHETVIGLATVTQPKSK